MSNEERLSIDEKKRQGMSVKEIAKMFKRSSQTISRALEKIGAMNAAIQPMETTTLVEARRAAVQTAQSQPTLPPSTTQQQLFPQVTPLAVYDSFHGSVLKCPSARPNALSMASAVVLSVAEEKNKAARKWSAARAVQSLHAQTDPSDLPPPQQQRTQQQQSLSLQHQVDADDRRKSPTAALGEPANKISAPTQAVPILMSVISASETTQVAQPQPTQTNLPVVAPTPRQHVRVQPSPLQVPADASRRQCGPTLLIPPAVATLNTVASTNDLAAATGAQDAAMSTAHTAQPPSAQNILPPLPPPKQTSSTPPPQQLFRQQPMVVPMAVGSTGNRSESTTTASPEISKPTSGATSTTSTVVIPGIAAAGASTALIGRRPITRPPRVFALTRPASIQIEKKGVAWNGSQDQDATAKTAAAKSNATSTQRVARKATETIATTDADLMSLLLGIPPDDDTSPQTSQEDELTSSQIGNLSQASNTSSKEGGSACLSQVSLSQQNSSTRVAPYGKSTCGSQTEIHQDVEIKKRSMQFLLSSLQDQIENLQPEHIGDDTSKVYQLLSKFRDELGMLNLDMIPQSGERKRKRETDAYNMVLGKLLHEKMAAEVALMNIQVQRERAQLDRERMKTKVEAALSRKKLEDASIPKSAIDSIFAKTMAN